MKYRRVPRHLRGGHAGVAEIAFSHDLFRVFVPGVNVIDAEAHHEIFGPIFDIVILQPKRCTAKPAVQSAAPAIGHFKAERRVKSPRQVEVFCGREAYENREPRFQDIAVFLKAVEIAYSRVAADKKRPRKPNFLKAANSRRIGIPFSSLCLAHAQSQICLPLHTLFADATHIFLTANAFMLSLMLCGRRVRDEQSSFHRTESPLQQSQVSQMSLFGPADLFLSSGTSRLCSSTSQFYQLLRGSEAKPTPSLDQTVNRPIICSFS